MTGVLYGTAGSTAPPPVVLDARRQTLRLQDLTTGQVLNICTDPWRVLLHQGCGDPPSETQTTGSRDYDGDVATYWRALGRPLALTLRLNGEPDEIDQQYAILCGFVRPMGLRGNRVPRMFRLWSETRNDLGVVVQERYIDVVYTAGLEGSSAERPHRGYRQFVLSMTAYDPWVRERAAGSFPPFRLAEDDAPMVTDDPAAEFSRQVTSSVIVGNSVTVTVAGEVPTFMRTTVTGPMDSLRLEWDSGLSIDVPGGLEAGETLRVRQSRDRKSITVNDVSAPGRVDVLASRLVPVAAGVGVVSVLAPGATPESSILFEWDRLVWSLL